MVINVNSIDAYYSENDNGRILKRRIMVYNLILRKEGLTSREIMKELNFNEPNQVRPRITELLQKGLIKEGEKIICEDTKKIVSTFFINNTDNNIKINQIIRERPLDKWF